MTKKQLKKENQDLLRRIKDLGNVVAQYNRPPEGCKRGAWCLSCQYGHIGQRGYYTDPRIAVECCYGACENFTPHAG